MSYILSVDAGTTASKISLFDLNGRLKGIVTKEYQLITPSALEVELAPSTLWEAFINGVKELLLETKIDPREIKAIGISAQGETITAIDKEGNALRNFIVWLDSRAEEEAKTLDQEFDSDVCFKTTGQVKMVPTWPSSKILWMKNHEPKIFEKVDKFLLVEDYLIWKLTGEFVSEGSLLCSTTYWNINTKKWWSEVLDFIGVDEDQLPAIRESGEVVAGVRREVGQQLGLKVETIVCTGALDQAAGAIGVGNIKPGFVSENTGAALAICAPLDKPIFDPKKRMPVHYFSIPNMYMAHTFTTGGMVLRWFRDNFCQEEISEGKLTGVDPYNLIDKSVETVEPGSEGLVMLPHLQGAMAPESNPNARGVFYGFTLRHGKSHFARAIMESIACIVRRNLDVIEDMGIRPQEIRVLGGGAKSQTWNQIKADMIGKPLSTTENSDAACLGAAILAGKATGIYPDIDSACKETVHIQRTFQPSKENSENYDQVYHRYIDLYDNLRVMFG